MARVTGSHLIGKALQLEGVSNIFTLAGDHILPVLDVMADLSAEGMTSIVVTHEMGFARRAADHIVFMEQGEIVEKAPGQKFFGGSVNERARRFLDQILH